MSAGFSPYKSLASGGASRGRDERWTTRYKEIHAYEMPGSEGSFGIFPSEVQKEVVQLLTANGKRKPYSHQVATAEASLHDGKNVVLVTPVASGKTTAFLSVVLTKLFENPDATAMLLYPMNALAEDQLKNLVELGFDPVGPGIFNLKIGDTEIVAGVLNGDTTTAARREIRDKARIILTNQVMLHAGLLAQACRSYADGTSWERILRNLAVVVLDEGHNANGVPGTETGLVLRRLWAQVESKGGQLPKVIVCTATIGNPVDHASALTGFKEWVLIDKSGAKSFPRMFKVILPEEHPKGGRWAASVIAQELALSEIAAGRRVLIFVQSRAATERMAIRINEKAGPGVCVAFNAAIPPEEKRELLEMILTGQAQGVVSTSALELGVDIGSLSTAILVGHPGDQASLFQRAGRVGRTSPGTVFLVLDENQHPINNYLASVPSAILDAPESRTIYPENERLAIRHAACCVLETGGNRALVRKWFPVMSNRPEKVEAASLQGPHASISMLGSGSLAQYTLVRPDGKSLQVLSGDDALLHWHPHALVRSFDGSLFEVTHLDHDLAKGFAVDVIDDHLQGYGTMPTIEADETALYLDEVILDTPARLGVSGIEEGSFRISSQTIAYKVIPISGSLAADPVIHYLTPQERNPVREFDTRGAEVCFSGNSPFLNIAAQADGPKWFMAMRDVLKQSVPLIVQARPADVIVKTSQDPMEACLYMTVLDFADGGMGWAEMLVRHLDAWFKAAGRLLANCRCKGHGCPKCAITGPDKAGRMDLADLLMGEKAAGKSPVGPIRLVKKG